MNPEIDTYLAKVKNWQAELSQLRAILLDCGLTEELKWKSPCYTYKGTNVILLGGFKEFCVISFIKGVLLKDEANILVQQGENSQSVRVAKFTSVEEIIKLESTIKAYIFEAIEVEKLGLKVELKKSDEHEFCEELIAELDKNNPLKAAFEKLTPGRQRGYNIVIASAKQSKTRTERIKKYEQRILDGYGVNDCTCGHSKRKPNSDGSHKFL